MNNNLESIFGDMTEEEFEEWFKECEIPYKKVEKGKGGLFIKGKEITWQSLGEWNDFANIGKTIEIKDL